MATAELTRTTGFAAISRALVSAAAEVAAGVERAMVGPSRVRTARSNAWDAMLADQARAQARAEMDRKVAALLESSNRAKRAARKPSLV